MSAAGTRLLAGPGEGFRTVRRALSVDPVTLAVGTACLTGIVAVTAAAGATGPLSTPYMPPGAWRPVLWVGMITSFAAYALGVVVATRRGGSSRNAVAVAVLIQATPLAGPLFASTDARGYDHYGRANPYSNWHSASVYGPLWSALSKGIDHIGETTFLFRLLATGSVLALVAMAYRLAARKALAVVFLGWNPLVALHFAGGGHNDAFMMALAVSGIALAASGRPQLGGAAWATSMFVKWVTAPLYLLWALEQRRRGKAMGLAAGIAAGLAIVALAYPLYGWTWRDAFTAYSGVNRIPASFGMLGWLRDLGLSTDHALSVSQALELITLGLFALQAWRTRLRLGLAAGVLTVLVPRVEAWYLLWCIALVSLDDRDRWGRCLAVILTGVLLSDILTPALNA
jgi:hypothetical protein